MKWFILCSYEVPTDEEWGEMAEFKTGTKEEIDKEFENAVVDGEFPYIIKGEVNACAKSAYDITGG